MLDNTITLAVDELNNDSTVDHIYTRIDQFQDRTVYQGPDHSLALRETMSVYRTKPNRSGNFHGVAKTSVKFTKDISVEGVDSTTAITAPMITTISFSFPVGVTDAEVLEERQKVLALLDMDTIMNRLNNDLEI